MIRWNTTIWERWQRHLSFRQIARAMNTKSTFNGSFTENPFWYQQFDLRQIRILRGRQPTVDYDTSDKCRLYVTTIKAMNFQDDIPSIPIDNFQDHYVLVFDLTSMQDATGHCHYQTLVGEPLRLHVNCNDALEPVTAVIVLGERMPSVAVDKFGVVGNNFQETIMDNVVLRQIINRIALLKYRYIGSFPCDFVPTLPNDTFAITNTQPSNMQGEHWIMIAKLRHQLVFADSLCRNDYKFLRKDYKRIIPDQLQLHQSLCGVYTIYAAFLLFKFGQEEITGVQDLNVPSFISICM